MHRFIPPLLILAGALTTAASADIAADQTVTLSDKAAATTFGHCGDGDLCAQVTYVNGDKLSIYSEGAAYCQPYLLHFVKTSSSGTIYEYSRALNHDPVTQSAFGPHCGNSHDTQMVMDRGLVHMTVTENHDGTLTIVFTPTKQGEERRQGNDGQ